MDATGDDLWFLDSRVTLRRLAREGADGVSILEHQSPPGDSPPLHVHHHEDEVFHVISGRVRLRTGDQERLAGPGDTVLAPKGVAHTYRVESLEGARFLTMIRGTGFETLVREVARPAVRPGLPDPTPPSPSDIQRLAAIAARNAIELVGPPLSA